MMTSWILSLFSFLLLLSTTTAQTYFPRYHQLEGSYRDARIYLSFECSNGLLLFGSDQGLLTYDGLSFALIAGPDSLRLNKVTAIGEDGAGNIWVGYDSGAMMQMAASTQSLQSWIIEEGWPAAAITGFAFDDTGDLWFGTYGEGIYCYRNGHLYNFDEEDGLPALDVYTIIRDPKGRILAGTDGGLSVCGWKGEDKFVQTYGLEAGLPDVIIRSLVLDAQGQCWAGTYEGGPVLVNIDDGTVQLPSEIWAGGTISCLAISPSGDLWIGTEGHGVIRLDTKQSTYHNSIPSGKVYDLRIDQEGNLWVMDTHNRLASYHLGFRYLSAGISDIQAVLSDRYAGIWLGTKQGLYYAPATDSAYVFTAWPGIASNVISLFEDDAHNIWIGTFGEGLYVVQPAKNDFFHFQGIKGLNNDNILSITGQDNHLWLGTLGGIYHLKYAPEKLQFQGLQFKQGKSEEASLANYIYSLQTDTDERVWIGTDGDGLCYWEKGRVVQLNQFSHLKEESVYTLAKAADGSLLLNSTKGLIRIRNGSIEGNYLPEQVLPSEVSAIWSDAKTDLLIVHEGGVISWHQQDSVFTHYTDAVGLINFDPPLNGITKNGQDLIIAASDYLVFKTLDFPIKRVQAKPIIKSVSASLENIPLFQKKPLAAHQNSLAFEITGLWYTEPSAIRYQYRMIGFDQDWITTFDQRIVYSKLPPGEYIFEIAASANGDFSHALVDQFQFRLRAPLWQRSWFIIALSIFLLGLLYYIIRQREVRLQRTAALKRDSVESKYETLKSQINPHFLFNSFNTLVAIIEEEPNQAVTYVEKLTDFYRSILQYREHELIPLSEELQIVADYLFLLHERYGENLRIFLPENGEKFMVAPLSLQMLCENAVKHNVISGQMPLTIHLRKDDNQYLWVENKLQPKLGNERSTGFGLQNISSRYALLSKRPLIIEKTQDHFRVGIPLITMSNA